jgi:hypothetical protein
MSHFPTGRGRNESAQSNIDFEARIASVNRQIDDLTIEYRHTFGKGAISSPQINDVRRHLLATAGPQGLEQLAGALVRAIKTRRPIAMDWWQGL